MIKRAVKRVREEKVQIPCPECGKRLFDWQGPAPSEQWSEEIKCRKCGIVFVTSNHIRKVLTNDAESLIIQT